MQHSSSPVSEAVERLGDAAVDNVTDVVARATTWATALGAAADPDASAAGASPVADDMAAAAASMWVGGLRAMAVLAAAVTDAAAILSSPPQLVETYSVDLADQLPARTLPVRISVQRVEWASPNATGALPVVSIIDVQPVAAPTTGSADLVVFRVRPSVAPLALKVTVGVEAVGAPESEPTVLELRLSTENLVVDQ